MAAPGPRIGKWYARAQNKDVVHHCLGDVGEILELARDSFPLFSGLNAVNVSTG